MGAKGQAALPLPKTRTSSSTCRAKLRTRQRLRGSGSKILLGGIYNCVMSKRHSGPFEPFSLMIHFRDVWSTVYEDSEEELRLF
jgi:hypothetical protein